MDCVAPLLRRRNPSVSASRILVAEGDLFVWTFDRPVMSNPKSVFIGHPVTRMKDCTKNKLKTTTTAAHRSSLSGDRFPGCSSYLSDQHSNMQMRVRQRDTPKWGCGWPRKRLPEGTLAARWLYTATKKEANVNSRRE